MADDSLTAERLREVVDYDPDTGIFTRKIRTAQRHHAGDRADFPWPQNKGYRRISIDSKRYLAHRIAWLYIHGEMPKAGMEVDHINGDPSDNRRANLRVVTRAVNQQNLHAARGQNKTGYLGVYEHEPGIYRSRIKVNGVAKDLGLFHDAKDAHEAYLHAKRKLHAGCDI